MELTISIIALAVSIFTFVRSLVEYRIRVKATVRIDYNELIFYVYNNSRRSIKINHFRVFSASSRYQSSSKRDYFHTYFDENLGGYKDIEPFKYGTFKFKEEDSIFRTFHKHSEKNFLELFISGNKPRIVKVR